MCDFKAGEEIICIDARLSNGKLIRDKTYICRDVYTALEQIFVCVFGGRDDPDDGWFAHRFRRPIVDETPVALKQTVKA